MRTHYKKIVAGCLTAALGLIGGPATAGPPSEVVPTMQHETLPSAGARDLVAFFVLGTGPMMDTHRELASDLRMQPQRVPDEFVDAVFEQLAAVDPDLAASVGMLESGDPVVVYGALERLRVAVEEALLQDGDLVQTGPGDGRGLVLNVNHFITTNVGAAVNVAVAVFVATVAVIPIFSADAGGGRYDQELFALKIAERL